MAGIIRGVDILLEFLHGELEIFEIWRKAVLPEKEVQVFFFSI
jgi:hypothetical protein